ncbi:MAG TPA: hypothetical protein PLH06_07355 [Candidatus Hydrogenedentes bacterium]|nr:hypothetical protein [Candidatus Hydrogenedentota bacterium]
MRKVFSGVLFVCVAVIMAGCPQTGGGLFGGGMTDLTVGGNPVTGYLQAGTVNWYRFQISKDKAGEPFDIIIRNLNTEPIAVGSIVRLFSSPDEKGRLRENELSLEWEHVLQPTEEYVRLTNEELNVNLTKDDVNEKAVRLAGFVAPQSGYYFISVEGYEFKEGKRPANDYQYRNTLAYTIAVRYTPRAGTQDGASLTAASQGAGVALTTGILRTGEVAFHPITLTRDTPYQFQVITNGAIDWCVFEASTCVRVDGATVTCDPAVTCDDCETTQNRFFTVPRDGQYYVKFENVSDADFGYAQYRVRVYTDDHGISAETATTLSPTNGSYTGYLTKCDTDYFKIVFPANAGTTAVSYTLWLTVPEGVTITGLAYDAANARYTLSVTQAPRAAETTRSFTVAPSSPDVMGLDGFGAYTFNVTVGS